MAEYTHFDKEGRPTLVDVSKKAVTSRTAWAEGWVELPEIIYETVAKGAVKKGDPFTIAELAGIMGAKRTPDLIPLCHTIRLDNVSVKCELDCCRKAVKITCEASANEVTRRGNGSTYRSFCCCACVSMICAKLLIKAW